MWCIRWTVWLVAALIVALAASAAFPPIPKRPHKSAAVHQGAGAALLIAKLAPAQPKIVAIGKHISWDWTTNTDNPASNIVFLVCSSPTLLTRRHDYPVIGITATNSWPFTVNLAQSAGFFVVIASNTVNHTESR